MPVSGRLTVEELPCKAVDEFAEEALSDFVAELQPAEIMSTAEIIAVILRDFMAYVLSLINIHL